MYSLMALLALLTTAFFLRQLVRLDRQRGFLIAVRRSAQALMLCAQLGRSSSASARSPRWLLAIAARAEEGGADLSRTPRSPSAAPRSSTCRGCRRRSTRRRTAAGRPGPASPAPAWRSSTARCRATVCRRAADRVGGWWWALGLAAPLPGAQSRAATAGGCRRGRCWRSRSSRPVLARGLSQNLPGAGVGAILRGAAPARCCCSSQRGLVRARMLGELHRRTRSCGAASGSSRRSTSISYKRAT